MTDAWPNTVTIGSFVADQDTPGDSRVTTNVEGWGSPARRLTVNARSAGNGSYLSNRHWAERTIAHSGLVQCSSPTAARAVADELAALDPASEYDYTVTSDAAGPVSCRVRVVISGDPVWIDGSSFTYTLTLVAGDPFKHASTATTVAVAAGATVSHAAAGTVAAEIEVTLTSAGTVDLTIAGLRLRTGSLPSGAVLTSGPGFTRPKRTIQSSTGDNLFGQIIQPMQWPAIVNGANTLHQAGTAGLSVRYFPTYA